VKAIIPAAGLGTRFLPVTKAQPKEMLPVVDKPVIQYVVEEAVAAGVDDILMITGRGKRAIEDHFDRSVELEQLLEASGADDKLRRICAISDLADIYYVRQKHARGLGHAVLVGASHVSDAPFFVLLGDVIVPRMDCLPRLRKVHEKYGGSVLAVTPVDPSVVSRYGVIDGVEIEPGVWKVTDLVEKPASSMAPTMLAIFGRYLLTPEIMKVLPNVEPGRGGEIQLTDALKELLRTQDIYAVVEDDPGFDTGNVLAWLSANVALGLESEHGPALRAELERLLAERA
jgi:UTP--glucose-1-phosphate uridylyltransferase